MKNICCLLLIFFFACNNKQEQSQNSVSNKEIIGTWTLESDAINGMKSDAINRMKKQWGYLNEISFFEDGHYKQIWWNDDVGHDHTGIYFYNKNPKRGFKTITLIPDIIIFDGMDTILIPNQNLDVFSISSDELVTVYPTEWVTKVDGKTYRISKKDYFTRVNNRPLKTDSSGRSIE